MRCEATASVTAARPEATTARRDSRQDETRLNDMSEKRAGLCGQKLGWRDRVGRSERMPVDVCAVEAQLLPEKSSRAERQLDKAKTKRHREKTCCTRSRACG